MKPILKSKSDPDRKKETYRNEWKYFISWGEKELITSRISTLLHPDPNAANGQYMIRSLYFDDYWQSAYAEKDEGVLERKKYRIRIYNCSDRSIKLERKKKYGAYIYKQSASLTRAEFDKILAGDYDFLLTHKHPLCREFYVECRCNGMRPRTIVDYDREPWILDAGTVRITFDMNVRAAIGGFDIFDSSLPTLEVVDPDRLVLEVKFTEFLPRFIQDILPPQRSEMSAISKYVLCYDKTQYLFGEDYWYDEGHGWPDTFSSPILRANQRGVIS